MIGVPITCTASIFRVNLGLSLNSEDDLHFGCQNISHRQLFFKKQIYNQWKTLVFAQKLQYYTVLAKVLLFFTRQQKKRN